MLQVAIAGCKGAYARLSGGASPDQSLAAMLEDYDENNPDSGKTVGLVFSVPKAHPDSLRAYSLLLPRTCRGRHAVLSYLKRLQGVFPPEGTTSSCAFIFSCCGRGDRFHRQDGVELAAFREAFPNTPVAGLFVYGEIGETYLGEDVKTSRKAPKSASKMRHTFSAIILVLAFKQP